jgi:transcriptional regulator with PAS, ATPase and Fis domain
MDSKLKKIAFSNNTILITGKTGTGKSHLAKEIHELSNRRNEKFVSVNLATLSENLIESELFGHERGSFSGADAKRIGKLEWANKGTIFLDEIGELPLKLQSKLLEALNSRTITPVGSNKELSLDIRIITATNKDLESMVLKGEFREDLFYRINSFQVKMPELKGNRLKIEKLAKKFAQEYADLNAMQSWSMGLDYLETLCKHDWPGNVRELKNAIEYSLALSFDGKLGIDTLPALQPSATADKVLEALLPINYRSAKEHFEKIYLMQVLTKFEGKINKTAQESGLSKVTLIEKIKRYEIDIPTIKYKTHLLKSPSLGEIRC